MTRLEILQRKKAQQPLSSIGWARNVLRVKQGKHRYEKTPERIGAAVVVSSSTKFGFRRVTTTTATMDERQYHDEALQDPIPIDAWTGKAMRLAVLDRIVDSATPSSPCTLLEIVATLKSNKTVFDLFSQQEQEFGGWFQHSFRMNNKKKSTQTQYKLMKAFETLEHNPASSQKCITSWEEAQNELQIVFAFQEETNIMDMHHQKPTAYNKLREQTFTVSLRKLHQKLNALSQASLSNKIRVEDIPQDYIHDHTGYSHLDRADIEFIVRFRQEQDKLFAVHRTSRAVLLAEAKLIEHERQEAIRIAEEQAKQAEEEARKAEARKRASDLMRPLTNDEQQRVQCALHKIGPPAQVIAQIGADSVQRASIQRLLPGQWLNDEVIHFFLTVLAKRDELICKHDPSRRRSHFFKSFFMTSLTNEGHSNPALDGKYEYKNVKRWSKKVPGKDLFQLDKVFFPINQGGMHWVCAVAYMQEQRVQFYDSLGSPGNEYLHHVLRYLKDEHQDKKKKPLSEGWTLVECNSATTPRQLNGYDCGVFVCMFIDFLAKDCPLVFGQSHITQCRERIALSILNGTAIM